MLGKLTSALALGGCLMLFSQNLATAENGYFYFTCEVTNGPVTSLAVSNPVVQPFKRSFEWPDMEVPDLPELDKLDVIVNSLSDHGMAWLQISESLSAYEKHFLELDVPRLQNRLRTVMGAQFETAVHSKLGAPCAGSVDVYGPWHDHTAASADISMTIRSIARMRPIFPGVRAERVTLGFSQVQSNEVERDRNQTDQSLKR